MRIIKYVVIVLFWLITLALIFNKPGLGNLSNFYGYIKNPGTINPIDFLLIFPPGTSLILKTLLETLPPDARINFFYNQSVWVASKILIFSAYLLTWVTAIYFTKSFKKLRILTTADTSLAYFGNVSLLLSSLALGFFDILAAPFFILSLTFLFNARLNKAVLLYQLSILFSTSLLIFSPLYFIFIFREKKLLTRADLVKIAILLGFNLILITNSINKFINFWSFPKKFSTETFSLPWLIDLPFRIALERPSSELTPLFLLSVFVSVCAILALCLFLKKSYPKLRFTLGRFVLTATLVGAFIFSTNTLYFAFLFLCAIILFSIYRRFYKINKISKSIFLSFSFCAYLSFLLFFPGTSPGNTIWLSVISLVIFLASPSKFNKLLLITTNILVFINLFVFFGSAGIPPVRGNFFSFFISLLSLAFIIFSFSNIASLTKPGLKLRTNLLKKFIVAYLLLVNIAIIPAQGTSDTVSWTQYAQATTQHTNPFYAQTVIDQRYPPLSTVIMGAFANLWKSTVGFRPRLDRPEEVSLDYALSIKVSIFVFYILTILLSIKFGNSLGGRERLLPIDAALVILTTFSLTVQTQGLADVNIHTIPTLIASIIALYKRKYFLSGILLGTTISIKWQPVILIPLFGATLFDLKQIRLSISRSVSFLAGFIPIPLIVWRLVTIQPGGLEAFERSFEYLKNGAPMLSGQALNLNWIVTYLIHIFQPEKDVSLSHLEGLNRQIPTSIAPTIFQGYLFYFATFVILLIYWFLKKKNITDFISASLMIFFSHFMLNKSAYEKHLFYVVVFSLLLYLIRPTKSNRWLLILFDIMTIMNLAFFYGFTGPKDFNRLFLGFDLTVLFSFYYLIIYFWISWSYLKEKYSLDTIKGLKEKSLYWVRVAKNSLP